MKLNRRREKPIEDPEETIAGKIILTNSTKHPQTNVYNAINSLYDFLKKKKLLHEENTYWSQFDMSKVNNTALLAFTDIPKANLKALGICQSSTYGRNVL